MIDDSKGSIVPFGKYKGRLVEELVADDPAYLQWLCGQDWFRAKFVTLHQVIINRGAEPEETPEHNALQVKFLDEEFCEKFLDHLKPNFKRDTVKMLEVKRLQNVALIDKSIEYYQKQAQTYKQLGDGWAPDDWRAREREKYAACAVHLLAYDIIRHPIENVSLDVVKLEFEERGVDVVLQFNASSDLHPATPPLREHKYAIEFVGGYWENLNCQTPTFRIEIKPTVGDDYPAVLRQMKRNESHVLLVGNYIGTGATREQFVETLATADKRVVFIDEIV